MVPYLCVVILNGFGFSSFIYFLIWLNPSLILILILPPLFAKIYLFPYLNSAATLLLIMELLAADYA